MRSLAVLLLVATAFVTADNARADYTAANLPDWAIGPFTRYAGNPVLSPPGGSGYSSADIFNPGVVVRGGTFQMLYRGQNSQGISQIGYASSTDGHNFTRQSDSTPVIPNTGSNERSGVEDPRLYTLNGTYYSFFTGYNGNTTDINEATSPDGIHWTQLGPVETNNKDASVVTNPDDIPVLINGKYVMYYGQSQANNGTFIAYSTDMVHWTTGTSINLNLPNSYFPYEICVAVADYQTIAGGPTNPNINLFIAGTLSGGGRWFYAISELEMSRADPTKVLHQLSDAVLSPSVPYEVSGQTLLAVFMNSITFYNGQWWMYYGAGDHVTALATAPLRPPASPPPVGTPFLTSFETGQPLPDWIDSVDSDYPGGGKSGVGGICCGLTGPETSLRMEAAKTGSTALVYSGSATGAASDYAYTKVEDLSSAPITVDSNLHLFYSIYPQGSSGNVTGTNSTCVSLDLIFSDGTTLSSLGAMDENGHKLSPDQQCGNLTRNQWNSVSSLIGTVAAGKQIVRIDVGYSQPGGSGGYRGYVDDIALTDSATPPLFGPDISITSTDPTSVRAGDVVTVNGAGFGATMPANGLYFSDGGVNWGQPTNGATVSIDSWSDTRITFTVPIPSGPGNQWRLRPGSNAYICIADNCRLSGGAVQPPSGSFSNFSLPIANSDTPSDYYGGHVGIAPDSHLDCQNQFVRLDSTSANVGNFLDADALQHSLAHPDAGTALTPGSVFTGAGLTFVWPNTPSCTYDNISTTSSAQTILMPPNNGETNSTTTTLGFLGVGAGGPTSGPITINYGDGTSSTQTLDFGDWCQATPADQSLVNSPKRTDGTICHLFQKVVPVTAGEVVTSIVLPATSGLNGGADRMRIFGIALAVDGKTFPQLAWNHPADIEHGTLLSATQLNATAGGVAGTFAYPANPAGTVLHVGVDQPLSATFTPTDTSHFVSGETISTNITVNKYTPHLSWTKPADITFDPQGIGLGPKQLDAKSDVAGSFAYTPQFGTILTAGSNELLGATFTPTNTDNNLSGGIVTTHINVHPYRPKFVWSKPLSIVYGTPLSVIQLDPIADSPGTFAFSPPAGTILHAGSGHKLQATFTPIDTVDYVVGGTVTAKLDVTKRHLKISAAAQKLDFTDVLPNLSIPPNWKGTGFVNGDTSTALSAQPVCGATKKVTDSGGRIAVKPGVYSIACHGAAAGDYLIRYAGSKLTVLKEDVMFSYGGALTFKKGASVNLSATLERDGLATETMSGFKVVLGFKGGKTCNATTNISGVASCTVSAPSKVGAATVTMAYGGTAYYLAHAQTANVQVTT